jgi:hypothetical protein
VPSAELERLGEQGLLQREAPIRGEFQGLVESGAKRLADAQRPENSLESRFDLAYGASHSLPLAALRWHGYRPERRYVVFQALAHTLGLPASTWRVLAKCHQERNQAEYEGVGVASESLVSALVDATREVLVRVRELARPGG